MFKNTEQQNLYFAAVGLISIEIQKTECIISQVCFIIYSHFYNEKTEKQGQAFKTGSGLHNLIKTGSGLHNLIMKNMIKTGSGLHNLIMNDLKKSKLIKWLNMKL